jgi:hypothetical protein
MTRLQKANPKAVGMLTVIDCFSKKAYARVLRNKTATEVARAFQSILKESGTSPKFLHTDRGTEFLAKTFQKVIENHQIHHYFTHSGMKATLIERFHRTFRNLMSKYLVVNNTLKWPSALPKVLEIYNNRKHRTINMAPNEVTRKNSPLVLQQLIKHRLQKPHSRGRPLKAGTLVRISTIKPRFSKEADQFNWTEELFRIKQVKHGIPRVYLLEDLLSEPIEGTFYREEIKPTSIPQYARISKVLGRKNIRGMPYIRVRWSGYSSKFDQWIPSEKAFSLVPHLRRGGKNYK